MPRQSRIVVPGHPHHITLRGNNRRRLFSYPRDRKRFLHLVRASSVKNGVDVHALDLLTNHVHLLASPSTEASLGRFVKGFAEVYSAERNRRMKSSGKLFEQRFFSLPIQSDNHFGATQAYVETNARRAGLVEDPADDRWSTYSLFGPDGKPSWKEQFCEWIVPSSWYLDLAGDPDRRARLYREWVERSLSGFADPPHVDVIRRIEDGAGGSIVRRPNGSSAL